MIYKKSWTKSSMYGIVRTRYTGWFLLGFIPIYIVRERS